MLVVLREGVECDAITLSFVSEVEGPALRSNQPDTRRVFQLPLCRY